jgi:hypothetical protein
VVTTVNARTVAFLETTPGASFAFLSVLTLIALLVAGEVLGGPTAERSGLLAGALWMAIAPLLLILGAISFATLAPAFR